MAPGEAERSDASAPVEGAVGQKVFVRVPESTVIYRINAHAGVITPSVKVLCLRASSLKNAPLALKTSQWVRRHASRKADRRVHAGTRDAVTDRDIANLVHRGTPHPAGTRVRRVRPLLVHNGCAVRVAYLIPSHGRDSRCVVRPLTAGVHGVVDDQRLVVAKVPVGQSVHQPIANRVELLAGPRLRDAGPPSAGFVERGDGNIDWAVQGGVVRVREVNMESVKAQRI